MDTVTYKGKEYTTDGQSVFCEGKKIAEYNPVKFCQQITALKVDDRIYYQGKWFTKSK